MLPSTLSPLFIGEEMPKKKKELPVFVVVDMPNWKSRILDFMLVLLRIPGKAWVIGVEGTGFTYDGEYYNDKKTGLKIAKKVIDGEEQKAY
jgi:hypothetical protein